MGRLIRNILLTFAQFEREIASDRMRDKKMVMKQSGRWTGGNPPVGYDLRRGRLVPNVSEAAAVRCLFETYAREQRIAAAHKALIAGGHRRKTWRSASGERCGGTPISLTALHHILQNPVYIGEVTYRGKRHPGLHEGIVDRALWDKVQAVIADRRQFKPRQPEHVLAGLLWDAYGRRMNARQSRLGPGSHRYYESAPAAWAARQSLKVLRVRADQIEVLVRSAVQDLLCNPARLRAMLIDGGFNGPALDRLCAAGRPASARLAALTVSHASQSYKLLLSRVEIAFDRLRIGMRVDALTAFLAWDGIGMFRMSDHELLRAKRLETLEVSVHLYRQKRENWLPVRPAVASCSPDHKLAALLDEAREAQRLLYTNRAATLTSLAQRLGRKPDGFSRLIRLNYLAPDIIAAITDGTQPEGMTRAMLMRRDLPLDWALQRRQLGFRPLSSNRIEHGPHAAG